jgi:hypothetical protein
MGLLDKAKAAAEQAAARAKEGVDEVQTKRELGQAYGDLGKVVFDLVEKGELQHAELTGPVEKIRALRARAESDGGSAEPAATASQGPPAMPN